MEDERLCILELDPFVVAATTAAVIDETILLSKRSNIVVFEVIMVVDGDEGKCFCSVE